MKKLFFLLCFLFLNACISSAPKIDGFQKQTYKGQDLVLTGFEKNVKFGKKLRIYIDGDAKTGGLFSKKAVLEHPVAAKLAQKDKSPSILYLNRPCYYSDSKLCTPVAWEEGRYNNELIEEMLVVLLKLIEKYKIPEIEFVGYDGGAAISLLLATRLSGRSVNVSKVITIAGILDTEQYAKLTDEDLHENYLNPAKEGFALSQIPQVHIVGKLDKKVPEALSKLFKKNLMNPVSYKIQVYSSADHYNWEKFKMDY